MKMTKLIFPILLGMASVANAQKFGYVDTKYILEKMPEYSEAQSELDGLAKSWETEIQQMYSSIQSMYSTLKAEEVLMTEEMKEQRMSEIKVIEDSVVSYHTKVFGIDGLLFLKRKELVKPMQERVFESVEKVAKDHRLQIVFDKSGGLTMIYTNPIHDYTDFVLEELGLGDPNDTAQE